jgi:predicted transcriptional regulator
MPTSKHRISLSLADDEYTELSDVAANSRVSMAWLARQALIEFLDRHRDKRVPAYLPMRTLRRAVR